LRFPATGLQVEFGLGWPPGGMEEGGKGGLADVGEDRVMGSESVRKAMKVRGVWQEGGMRGKHLIGPCQKSGPLGRPGVGWLVWWEF